MTPTPRASTRREPSPAGDGGEGEDGATGEGGDAATGEAKYTDNDLDEIIQKAPRTRARKD